jgi:outer membrane autotransporter protein
VRAGGAAEITNADTLDWTVTFSEAVTGVDGADFALTASSASLAVTGSGDTWTVTASGGDLAGFNGAVGLDVSGSAAFADAAGNAGAITEPATDEGYVVDNDSPVLTAFARNTPAGEITDADTLVFDVTFSKPVINVTADDFEATGTTATAALAGSGAAYTITLSGGDLAELNGVVGLDLAAVQDIADTAGNALLAAEPASDETYTLQNDTEAPRLASVTRLTPADAITAADTLVFQVSFSEDVANVTADDFAASASSAAASGISGVSASVYEVTLSGGDLAGFDGTVGLELASGQDIADLAGNALTDPAVTGADESYTLDNTAPAVTLSRAGSDPVSGAFELTITFTEAVSGFELSDITVAGGAVSDLATDDDTVFTATVTPSGDGTLTLDVAEGAAADAAGNASTVAETLEVEADATAPELAIALPGETTTGVFTASFTFTEAVAGFALDDIAVTNGAASDLASEDDTVFTATITPQAPGTVTIDVAEGAAADAAGNPSTAAGTSIEAVAEAEAVVLELTAATAEPGSVAASVNLTNPGSDPLSFNASADVDWLDVSPASGTVPSLGALALTIALNDAVNALEPGDYTGTVTVSTASGAAGTASTGAVLVQIPVSLSVAQRFGSITLVATTPSGASGEASFIYASDIEAFNGLTLTTSGGRASASVSEALFGTYALSQSLPAGWRVESIACAGDLDGGSSVNVEAGSASLDLDPGESLVCTFENVRDEEAVRIATQRAIRNFMVRRADQIMQAAPDLSRRFEERGTTQRGGFGADMDGSGRYQMAFTTSLSGLRNAAAAAQDGAAQFANPERPFLDGWDVWIAAEVSGVSDNRAGERAESDFGVAQLGVDYQLRPDLIVGALAQYDWMSETAQDIFEEAGAVRGARVEGEGWMAGPYAVWRIRDSLILDGLALYGQSDNQVDPLGLYEDDFETDRFMLRANLTGEFASGAWRLRPQAGLTHFEETQAAYTDSLGIAIPEQTIAIGRLRAGPEVAWRSAGERGSWFEVRTAVNAVWDYQAADLLSETGQLTGGDESLRADARFGLAALTRWGALIGIETGYAGLGQGDFEARSLRLEIRIPFGAAGSGGGASLTGAAGALFGPECGGVHAGYDQAFAGAGGCADPGFGAVQQP